MTAVLKRLSYCPRSAASLVYLLYSVHVVLFYCSKYTLGCCQPGLFYTWIRYPVIILGPLPPFFFFRCLSYLLSCCLVLSPFLVDWIVSVPVACFVSFPIACLVSFTVACLVSFPIACLVSFTVLSSFLLPVLSPLLLPVFLLSCYLSFFFFTVVYFSSSCYLSSFLLPVFLLYFCPSCFFPVASLISAINGTGNYWVFLNLVPIAYIQTYQSFQKVGKI